MFFGLLLLLAIQTGPYTAPGPGTSHAQSPLQAELLLFLGQNDLCMSLGLYEKYQFPDMYFSDELRDATDKLRAAAKANNVILGLFLFGTDRVGEFLEKDFTFISLGNDLHHVLTQTGAYVANVEEILKEKGKPWTRRPTALF